MMSRRIIMTVSVALLMLAIAVHTLLAARVQSELPTFETTITADSGSFKKLGNKLSATFNNNVTLTSDRNGLTSKLNCQRLQADDISSESMDAEATGAPKISYEIELQENGVVAKYRIDISGESIAFDKKQKQLVVVQGGKSEQAVFLMTPLDKAGKRQARLVADRIDYRLDAANSAQTNTPFVSAGGSVALSAIVQAKQTAKDAVAASYRLNATAERIVGQFERIPGGTQISQAFYLSSGKAARPHVDVLNLDEKTPDRAKLDADSMVFYPQVLSSVENSSTGHLLLAKAAGDVKIFTTSKQGKDTVTMQGGAGELLYRFYPADNPSKSYDRVICLQRGDNGEGTPSGTYQDGADSKPIPFRAPFMLFNLDQQLFSLAKTLQQGEANIGVKGGRQ